MRKIAVVAAGGTGGHLFPAQALAEALIARGWRIVLASDERAAAFAESFPAEERIGLSARTFQRGDVVAMGQAGIAIVRGVMQARAAFTRIDPAVVVGFGGYPSVPGLLAGITQGRPTLLHEQNAVMGRANRRLAGHVRAVACAFPVLQKAPGSVAENAVVVGNPIRPDIRALADHLYTPPTADGPIRLLITGGSQGARLLSELMPEAIKQLPEDLRHRLDVQQQTRKESMDNARRIYADAMVKAEIAPFFRDMATRLRDAHLVIGRSGAGSVCEFAVAGKPAILVPLAIALDDDQGQNARVMAEAGGAEVARENQLTVDTMAGALQKLLTNPDRLARMAAGARSIAKPDAAERLADLVERTAVQK
ncbi:UDP-N-acetylglucosamine--N-acetylmuramyl-(pentapeptide) pyrophosphoryl-undecaprenol N-acetylglucosamine transferase [Phenylobacterium sp. Root77]|uniref:undecaprenyldiphospho-muramoylpentapeptide beta-N-acetylglucosaminyltransferase n=1 Tax=unclassified Phenylobacterium TaxID=2640670 RepID=UPI0006F3BFB1|nr:MULTISPECIES: undecaprenyldiphospho-muramoylpentapeptide beta-N-acetylglucosaminyltransferase [unclassified Phenylobacterium]KQW72187.1 UDP-N-acetylglucosamine--N-acetylmuramyl-(pentapeptide) pyrophosphoryl-undecaprenol N-acetylglucosamine transferase [Phenylobacterium sp. Root1277]KQW95107.1 UDP-N-acetylglucosamine--N-acetylmuramyl-(pentapeptide) pyrophosphoryl-undecaprenol N-acetylglucosamine transferase [Phenylobacterium sp. Root1290]KRC44800.1 UDP-N-acetylglucosamine--N-acetylmuramyl-(pen